MTSCSSPASCGRASPCSRAASNGKWPRNSERGQQTAAGIRAWAGPGPAAKTDQGFLSRSRISRSSATSSGVAAGAAGASSALVRAL
ncbi:hypothetical protein G6F24_018217 [Rhizopus arrhizus]|nr:hypothetical protein G6F24_018217 [Rhizopus arrhizus]